MPGAGKTTVSRRLLGRLREREERPLLREDAVTVCLRRRDDGLLKHTMKRLPGWVWQRFMGPEYAMDALRSFCVHHPLLAAFVMGVIAERGLNTRDADIVLGSFFRTFSEHRLLTEYLGPNETLLMDEGHTHRGFTLFGYLAEPLPRDELVRYADLVPLPDLIVWVDTPAEECEERLGIREGVVFQYPIQLADLSREDRIRRLAHGADCLRVLTERLAERGVRVHRLENGGSEGGLASEIERIVDAL